MSKKSNVLKRERNAFEWTILALSLAAIAAIVAGLVVSAIGYESGPPALKATITADDAATDSFVLTVANSGGATAEDVRVLVRRGTGSMEVEFRAVPKGDEAEATVTIGGTGTATAHVQSYQEP